MPSLLPSPSDDYAAPQDMRLNKAAWDAALVSVGLRLRALEAIKADFEALIALGTGQALEVIQANVAPQLEDMRATLAALETGIAQAEDLVHDIVTGSIPASAVVESAARLWLTPALKARIEASASLDSVARSFATIGGAGNRLPNASGAAGLAGVSTWGPSNMTSGVAGVLGQHSVWVPPGVNGWFLIQPDEANAYSGFDFLDGAGNPPSVQAGELYQFSIYTGNHRAVQVYVEIVWLDAAGAIIGTSNCIGGTSASGSTVVGFSGANGGASPEAASGQRFEDARRLWVISSAPPGAVRVSPRLVKGPTKPGQGTSALFGYRPYFGEAAPGQLLPTAWSYGPATSEIRAAVDTRLRIDAAQALNDSQKAQGRANLGAQAALGYTPANKAGDTFTGNISVGTAVYQTDGNIYMPWAGGRYAHQLIPYHVNIWYLDNTGMPRLTYSAGAGVAVRGAGGSDQWAFSVQRGGDGATLLSVDGTGDLYLGNYGAALSTLFSRAKNVRLAGVVWVDVRGADSARDARLTSGAVMVGISTDTSSSPPLRTVSGFFAAQIQQQDVFGNWYGVTTE